MIGNSKPKEIKLQDFSRATMLAAARMSRTFPRPDSAPPESGEQIHTRAVQKEAASTNGSFWAESHFRVQMFRQDKWNRWVRVNKPLPFNSDQADIFEDSVNISLQGQDGLKPFYRGTGPMEWLLGGLYTAFGVELTLGEEYIIKVQVAQQGLPFYESGCSNGAASCEGEVATRSY